MKKLVYIRYKKKYRKWMERLARRSWKGIEEGGADGYEDEVQAKTWLITKWLWLFVCFIFFIFLMLTAVLTCYDNMHVRPSTCMCI